jgi:hypothetical protein
MAGIYVRGDYKIQNNGPNNGRPIFVSIIIDDIQGLKAQMFQRGVIGVFIQTSTRSRVVITLPKTQGEVFSIIKGILWQTSNADRSQVWNGNTRKLLVRRVQGLTRYCIASKGFTICPLPAL